MTIKEYQKLKGKIDKLLQEAEAQAVQEGIDITSPDFDFLLERLKEKVLLQYGLNYQDYLNMEEEMNRPIPNEGLILSLAKEIETKNNDKTLIFRDEMGKIKDWFSQGLSNLDVKISDLKNEVDISVSEVKKSSKDNLKQVSDSILNTIQNLQKINENKIAITAIESAKYRQSIEANFNENLKNLREELVGLQTYNLDNYDAIRKLRESVKNLIPKGFKEDWTLLTSGQLADALHKHDIRQRRGYGGVDIDTVKNLIAGRRVLRISTVADATSISVNADSFDQVDQTNTQAAGTLTINNPTGSPNNGDLLTYVIKCTNSQTLSFGNLFLGSSDLALSASTTGSSKVDFLGFKYSTINSKWNYVAKTFGFS